MATGKKNQSQGGKKPGTIEDAANALKMNAEGGGPDGEQSEGGEQSKADAGQEGGENAEEVNEVKPEEQSGESKGEGQGEGQSETENAEEGEQSEQKHLIPVPNAEEIEHSAQYMAEHHELFEACKKTVERARAIIAERNAPPKLSIEDLAAANYDRIVQKYGKDFVTAQKGNNKKYFTRRAWNNLGKNKQGWAEITKVMPEVQANTGK